MVVSESLPSNADPDTLSATVVNGVFTLVVDKLPEPEPEPEPVEEAKADSIVVEVKRKNRK
jgi:HSP20 family molecular chaperone IbpA